MSNLILFGAGASFGSKCVSPFPPPLGNGLFDGIMSLNKTASRMPEDIQKLFRMDFEMGMLEFYKRSHGNIMSFQREMAEYLLKFTPSAGNIYINLLKNLDLTKFTFSSLNYDMLFELSTFALGMSINYSSKKRDNHLSLLKIHGSSNFWPDMQGTVMNGCHSFGSGRADIGARIIPLNREDALRQCYTQNSTAPSLAMFAVGKRVNVSPDYTERQYRMWLETIAVSSKIFIIGVRVHEVDSHIWDVLGKSEASIYYFGFDSDIAEFNVWQGKYNSGIKLFVKSDFEDAIDFIKKNE